MKTMQGAVAVAAVLLAGSAFGQAPTWSDEQAEVWAVVSETWEEEAGESGKWPADYAHDSFLSWSPAQLAPRDLETYTKWVRMSDEEADTFWYEITPLAIVVEDETAVVMYVALQGTEDKDGEREMSRVSIVETLVRDGRNWKFLSSASFTPGDDD